MERHLDMDRSERRAFSRSELELELGRLALVLARLKPERARMRARGTAWPKPIVDGFLDACTRLLARTRPTHRTSMIRRLCTMAAEADLGLIGLEAWLLEQTRGATAVPERAVPSTSTTQTDVHRHA